MNWRPLSADDLIGQAQREVRAQTSKARRLAREPATTMKRLPHRPLERPAKFVQCLARRVHAR